MRSRLALALLLAAVAFGQEPGEIRGRIVSSSDGEPLAQVQVRLTATPFTTVTAGDGTFRIPAVPPAAYALQAIIVGFQPMRKEFTLAAGETKTLDLVLTSSTAQRKDTVDVSAGPFDAATQQSASAITLDGQERKNLASVLADDPLRAVQGLPGVTSNNDFSSEFSLRGAPFNRIGLYLDGILLHAPFHTTDGQADNGSLTIFNGDTTDEMTLYEGAWPVRYGDRTAGILAVETREGSREAIRGTFNASASNASILLEGPLGKNKRGSWLVSFRKSYLQYILNRIDFGDQAPFSFGFTDGQARLTYDLTPRHTVTLSDVEGSSSVDRTPYRSELGVSSVMTSGFRYSLVNFGSRYTPTGKIVISNHVAWSRERGEVANRDNAPLSNEAFTQWTWRADATVNWTAKNTLDFGGQFLNARQDGVAERFVYTPVLVSSLDTFRGTGHEAGAYAQQSFSTAANHVRLTAGVRQDEHNVSPVQITSPYASVSLEATKKTHVQFDWGQYGQFPELNQFFSTYALGRLLPERATHYEAVVEQRLDEHTRLRFELYDRQDRDLLAFPALDPRILPDGSTFRAQANAPLRNSERGYSRGMQVFLQRRTANGFTGWISYAYGRAVISDGDLHLKFPSDYDQRQTFNAYIGRRLRPTVNLSGRFTYGSGMPLPGFYKLDSGQYFIAPNRNGLRAPSYQRTDVRLNKAYAHKRTTTTLFAEVVNLTNHHNRDFDSPGPYDPITGRSFPNFFSMFPILPSAGMVFEF